MFIGYNTHQNVFRVFRNTDDIANTAWIDFSYDNMSDISYMLDDIPQEELFIMLAVSHFVKDVYGTGMTNFSVSEINSSPISEWFTHASNRISYIMDDMPRFKESSVDIKNWTISSVDINNYTTNSPSLADICAWVIVDAGIHNSNRSSNKLHNIMVSFLVHTSQCDDDIDSYTYYIDNVHVISMVIIDDELTAEDAWHHYDGYIGGDGEDHFVKLSAYDTYKLIKHGEVEVNVDGILKFTIKINT